MEKNKSNYVAIMAGGVGSRFWPASREHRPKQFLDILGIGKSLLRLTYERFVNIVEPENILVVTNKIYKDLVIEHIPEIPIHNIITEPSRNNTGPCVAYTAFRLEAMNPDACFVIAPSDHVILKEDAFLDKINTALNKASQEDAIITLGIEPTRPDTGYGYIETTGDIDNVELIKVNRFREKPDEATAESYLMKGGYYWNAGIFIWSVNTILNCYKEYAGDIYNILSEDKSMYNTDAEQEYIDRVYPNTPSISVDYAILENARNVYTIPADIGWSDLGTWNALHAYKDKDVNGSVVIGQNTMMLDSKNCIIKSDAKKLVVIKDLDNYIIIDEPDVLLVYPKDQEQSIKQLKQDITDKSFI